ncbi:hypothetical protein GE09DRAFT_296780 [Coniochaeta sp. 2T2.1]|nr:hypothetical protein GE09DRAFT_296780 [Coniochaeta sp. 2T2.1]
MRQLRKYPSLIVTGLSVSLSWSELQYRYGPRVTCSYIPPGSIAPSSRHPTGPEGTFLHIYWQVTSLVVKVAGTASLQQPDSHLLLPKTSPPPRKSASSPDDGRDFKHPQQKHGRRESSKGRLRLRGVAWGTSQVLQDRADLERVWLAAE